VPSPTALVRRRAADPRSTTAECPLLRPGPERKMGQMLIVAPKAKGSDKGGRPRQIDGSRVIPSKSPPTLHDIGLTKRDSSQAQKLARMPASAHARACAAACIPHAQGRSHAPRGIRHPPSMFLNPAPSRPRCCNKKAASSPKAGYGIVCFRSSPLLFKQSHPDSLVNCLLYKGD
jgi:hypothetical protein